MKRYAIPPVLLALLIFITGTAYAQTPCPNSVCYYGGGTIGTVATAPVVFRGPTNQWPSSDFVTGVETFFLDLTDYPSHNSNTLEGHLNEYFSGGFQFGGRINFAIDTRAPWTNTVTAAQLGTEVCTYVNNGTFALYPYDDTLKTPQAAGVYTVITTNNPGPFCWNPAFIGTCNGKKIMIDLIGNPLVGNCYTVMNGGNNSGDMYSVYASSAAYFAWRSIVDAVSNPGAFQTPARTPIPGETGWTQWDPNALLGETGLGDYCRQVGEQFGNVTFNTNGPSATYTFGSIWSDAGRDCPLP